MNHRYRPPRGLDREGPWTREDTPWQGEVNLLLALLAVVAFGSAMVILLNELWGML